MDHSLPVEILTKILLAVVATPSLLVNFSDDHYKFMNEDLITLKDIDGLPMFEHTRIGLAHEISFFNWPVDFYHNMPVYRAHQQHARTGILVCKTFHSILTPILYQCAVLATTSQAQRLLKTLENTQLATLVKTLIICPNPFFYPKRELVDRVVGACPNLFAFHNFSTYHSPSYAVHRDTRGPTLPIAMERLTHDPFAVAQIEQHPALCVTLVFLELTTVSRHWIGDLPVLQVVLPFLLSLKMEHSAATLEMMHPCTMPILRRLCLTRPLRHADVGKQSGEFLKKHGQLLTQLEYPDLLWGVGGSEMTLDAVCPALTELIVDPLHCIAAGMRWDAPPIRGPPGHPGVIEIGLRNIFCSGDSGMGRQIKTLISTESFPMLAGIRDMVWRTKAQYTEANWRAVIDLCLSSGVPFRDWTSSIVV
ncbi:hypothetical protein HYPSUDRAFT_207126 [Hypholoma sublateritium FD-334 SS-4]|uniref:Uncharacterized protein n=1 Tax=Hypholoma sublateritium (strain FD-334 SS-4) TaxID=945553 RepID=A0A0D2NI88_HYPSF|nr:hypothetical protein HYPSUDRAFT_207126 [Hypholoma sublateritium FD-334 SS-4]